MASFAVEIIRISDIQPIEGRDRIEVAIVGPKDNGFNCIVPKGKYHTGQLVAYIPEASIIPDPLLEELGLKGALHGPGKNRVKAMKMAGVVSQGLVWVPETGWDAWFDAHIPTFMEDQETEPCMGLKGYEGYDIADQLGIVKYVPEIPMNMRGKLTGAPDWMKPTDSENIKKHGSCLVDGERVFITEKVHGTQMNVGFDGTTFFVSSKGVLARGGVITEETGNSYWECFHASGLEEMLRTLHEEANFMSDTHVPVQIIGEAYGRVQDLTYGNPTGPLKFLAFDIKVNGKFLEAENFFYIADAHGIPTVPLLYDDPYSLDKVLELTDGMETVSGKNLHLREGVVVKPRHERNERFGRASLKSVSKAYLLRKGNTTEFE